jgi:eukaryotic-like serine/threonine-protein kinase
VATEESRLEGRRLADRYVLESEVASGGMGRVWRARDEILGRPVAVKILHDRLAQDPDVLERFRLEAVAAARLSHPCVVRVFDTGVDSGTCFIVMELFDGRPMDDILASRGPLSPGEAAQLIGALLQGLAHAHRQGVIHRDVKPGNILIDERIGLVKVTDFGIAKAAFAQDDLTTTGNLLGTASYLSPEQVSGEPVDPRTDLYASGVVLYEALTGMVPFEGETHIATAMLRLNKDPVPPGALRPGIPRKLEAVVMRALARDPDDRFQTAQEMAAALERSAPSPDTRRIRPSVPEPRQEERAPGLFRSWVLVPLALIALAGLAVGGFVLVERLLEAGGGEEVAADERGPLQELEVQGVASFDPEGDGVEHDEELPAAIDGNASTYWTTEGYSTANLGDAKPGVGIVFDLGEPTEVAFLRIRTDTPGWTFSVYEGDSSDGFDLEAPLASADGDQAFTAAATTALHLPPTEAQYFLIWITELAQPDEYRAHVNEADFFPPRER